MKAQVYDEPLIGGAFYVKKGDTMEVTIKSAEEQRVVARVVMEHDGVFHRFNATPGIVW